MCIRHDLWMDTPGHDGHDGFRPQWLIISIGEGNRYLARWLMVVSMITVSRNSQDSRLTYIFCLWFFGAGLSKTLGFQIKSERCNVLNHGGN